MRRPFLSLSPTVLVGGLCLWLTVVPAPAQLPDVAEIEGDPVRRALAIDGIPSIDDPDFVGAGKARFIRNGEPVLGVVYQGEARAYPIWHLDRHEVVNDRLGDLNTMATW